MTSRHSAGRQPESASLHNVLRRLGDGTEPFSEEMLFGLGGGIGFAYFLYDMHGGHPVYIGTRAHTKETAAPEFMLRVCEARGATTDVRHASSPAAATRRLRETLQEGHTPIVWAEITKLPYMHLSGHANFYHTVVVYGAEGDEFIVGDLGPSVYRVGAGELADARTSDWAPKFRSLAVTDAPRKRDVRTTILDRLRLTCSQMLEGLGIANIGLSGMRRWAEMLTNTKNAKGWPKCFPGGPPLHAALSSVFGQIELRGYGGSGFRAMYADFLAQAAGPLRKPSLERVAEQFRESEAAWRALSAALLPDGIPLLKETRALLTRRAALLRKRRDEKIDEELRSVQDGLERLREASASELRPPPDALLELFTSIRERVLEAEAVERAAFTQLNRTL